MTDRILDVINKISDNIRAGNALSKDISGLDKRTLDVLARCRVRDAVDTLPVLCIYYYVSDKGRVRIAMNLRSPSDYYRMLNGNAYESRVSATNILSTLRSYNLGDTYFYISDVGTINKETYERTAADCYRLATGNTYYSREEAESYMINASYEKYKGVV